MLFVFVFFLNLAAQFRGKEVQRLGLCLMLLKYHRNEKLPPLAKYPPYSNMAPQEDAGLEADSPWVHQSLGLGRSCGERQPRGVGWGEVRTFLWLLLGSPGLAFTWLP